MSVLLPVLFCNEKWVKMDAAAVFGCGGWVAACLGVGKELLIQFTVRVYRENLSTCVRASFPFSF